jgi:protein-S-isoprenylcysteine O-methyltransferase Ste14
MTTGERLAAELRRAWNGEPWHGPSVATVLARLPAVRASDRRSRGSHTPWELVLHLTTWVNVPLRRLDDPLAAPADADDFPVIAERGDEAWRRDVDALAAAVERLAQRVQQMSDVALETPVGDRGYTGTRMIDGVVQHLAYHAGQIALLERTEETAGVIAPPPLIVLGAMGVAELVARALPLPLPLSQWLGYPLMLAGLGLVWWASETFAKARTPAQPWMASRVIVLGGPYRFTRNPMYIGFLIVQIGMGVARSSAWYFALLMPAWALLHWGVVRREERYLLKKFGASYQQLLNTSKRWLV